MINADKVERAIRLFLEGIGEDPVREGLRDTPMRVAKMWTEFEACREIKPTTFTEGDYNELIVIKDIPFYSFCEHHILPFFGKVHIGYIPKGNRILGLSKIPRIVDALSLKLNIQEHLTSQIADKIMYLIDPLGVAVLMEAEHLCMSMRGVKKPNTKTLTSKLLGCFMDNELAKSEVIALLKGGR